MSSVASQHIDQCDQEEQFCSKKPVDLVHLSRQTFGSKELENEVLGLFVSHSKQCIDRLRVATTDKEWTDILHTIKGSARAIGAWNTGNLAEQYEQKVKHLTKNEKAEVLVEMQKDIEQTVDFISGLI